MSDLANRAHVMAIAVDVGLIERDEIIGWADDVIAQQSEPHWAFCELATSRNKDVGEVLGLLRAIPGEVDASAVQDLLIGFLWHALERNLSLSEPIVRLLYTLAPDLRDAELQRFASRADDAWDLAVAEISGTREEVIAALHLTLADAAAHAAQRGRIWVP